MTVEIALPSNGLITQPDFQALPTPGRGWAWELRDGRLELTHMPVTGWHWLVVLAILEYWRDQGFEILGEQYVADSGFIRGESGKHNVVADGVVFVEGHDPDPSLSTRDAADIHVIIEAVSADSEERDASAKREIYAALGIPHYWIVRNEAGGDGREGIVTCLDLVDGEYELAGHRLVSSLRTVS